jgi:cytochrome c oxidase assembly protein subunit 11
MKSNTANNKTLAGVFTIVLLMIGLSFAAVPLYSIFCKVTGFGGTTQVADTLPTNILERKITVRFDANSERELNWLFKPEQLELTINIGQRAHASYLAQNNALNSITGTATFNVTPDKAGKYFKKIECFCFTEQTLKPGQRVSMPVFFYIDPEIDNDPSLKEVKTITLSYSFFRIETEALEQGIEDFYNQANADISKQNSVMP